MLLEVCVVDSKQGRLRNPEAVMIDQTKKGPVSRICDLREELFNLFLVHVFRNVRRGFHELHNKIPFIFIFVVTGERVPRTLLLCF